MWHATLGNEYYLTSQDNCYRGKKFCVLFLLVVNTNLWKEEWSNYRRRGFVMAAKSPSSIHPCTTLESPLVKVHGRHNQPPHGTRLRLGIVLARVLSIQNGCRSASVYYGSGSVHNISVGARSLFVAICFQAIFRAECAISRICLHYGFVPINHWQQNLISRLYRPKMAQLPDIVRPERPLSGSTWEYVTHNLR